jgi:hypothetical protein
VPGNTPPAFGFVAVGALLGMPEAGVVAVLVQGVLHIGTERPLDGRLEGRLAG